MSEAQDRERIVGEHVRLYGDYDRRRPRPNSRSGRDRADSVGSILDLLADLVHRLPTFSTTLPGRPSGLGPT